MTQPTLKEMAEAWARTQADIHAGIENELDINWLRIFKAAKLGYLAGAKAMGARALPRLMHYDDTDSYRNGFQDAVSWQRQRIKAELAGMGDTNDGS